MTEREVVLRERAAFVRGAGWRFSQAVVDAPTRSFRPIDGGDIEAAAAETFPLPKVIRPRMVRIGNKEYRLDGDSIQFRVPCDGAEWCEHSDWRECQRWQPSTRTLGEVKALADLLARPTEEVEA